ncbi:MAG: hypothetical protein K5849_07560 [Bacteroidales bacterium]|nr:hypothetical protein [Bacteroidales bacterium]
MKTCKSIIMLALLPPLVFSCRRELPDAGLAGEGPARVPVALSLAVAGLEDGTPGTKTLMEPDQDVGSDDQIANFCILQFNGVTEDAQLVGGQVYFDHYPLSAGEKITLVASEVPNAVLILANTFGRVSITTGTTLGAFLAQDFTTINGLAGVFTESEGNGYLRMSGSKYLAGVTAGTSVNVILKRNAAKIVVNITNNTAGNAGEDRVTVNRVQLKEINAKYYYLAHLDDAFPGLSFTDPYSYLQPFRFDNAQEDFDAGGNAGVTQTYTYYVPANLRGTTANEYQYNKGNGAPRGATQFHILASYGADGTPVNYCYFLGGNLTNDFNLRPNFKYTYNISINRKGDPHYDYRIEDMAEAVFETDANSYILHPPRVAGQSRVYAIPVRRAAVYWNAPGVNLGVYGASQASGYESYTLDGATEWTAGILWSDFDMSAYMDGDGRFLQLASGRGFDPANPAHSQPYLKVRIPSGMRGNVVVAVKVDGVVLWSWHLWITDYDPDCNVTPVAGTYIYPVQNGEVHRYHTALWSKEASSTAVGYSRGFAMDRGLGALWTKEHDEPGSRGLTYEYGRKDPFLDRDQNNADGYFYLGGTRWEKVLPAERQVAGHETGTDGNKNLPYAVTHPLMYISGVDGYRTWTSMADGEAFADVSNGTSYPWFDRKFPDHQGDQALLENKKSIFDPCPPGWQVPYEGAGVSGAAYSAATAESGDYYFSAFSNGRYYYPETYARAGNTGAIFFPTGNYWLNVQRCHYPDQSFSMFILNWGVGSSNYTSRTARCFIRCVRE